MGKVQQLTNEALLKRASHAGRNLFALATLVTLAAILLVIAGVFAPMTVELVLTLPISISIAALGYWMLAIAAKRGNPTPVTIVMAVMSVQFLISVIAFCISHVRSSPTGQSNILWIIVALLVIAALANSRTVLLELKRRGLWEERFGSAKPSRLLCILGGIFLVVGYLGVMGGMFISAFLAAIRAKEFAIEKQRAQAFVRMIQEEEADFMSAMQSLSGAGDSEAVKSALRKVDALDQRVTAIQSEISADGPLFQVLAKYKQAVQEWRSGLTALESPEPDLAKVKEMLESGDRLRIEATEEFDRRYYNRR